MPETRSQQLMKCNKLSPDLAAIVGKTVASRIELIELLWAYLKKNKLECEDNNQFFLPDEKMAKVFGTEKIESVSMAKRIQAHLTPIYTINDSDDVKNDSDDLKITFQFPVNDPDDIEITFVKQPKNQPKKQDPEQGGDDSNQDSKQGDADSNQELKQGDDDSNQEQMQGDDDSKEGGDSNQESMQGDDDSNQESNQGVDDSNQKPKQGGDDSNQESKQGDDDSNQVPKQGDDGDARGANCIDHINACPPGFDNFTASLEADFEEPYDQVAINQWKMDGNM